MRAKTRPLAVLFPTLSFAQTADQFLAFRCDCSVLTQLARCAVRSIYLERRLSNWGLQVRYRGSLSACTAGWYVIRVCWDNSPSEQIFTIGHELGHVFELAAESSLYDADVKWSSSKHYRMTVEKFCNVFASRWTQCQRNKTELFYLLLRARFLKKRSIKTPLML